MNKIIVIGSSNTDMVIKSDRLPASGETILGGHFFMNPGGKGANQAVGAARLGGNVHFICKVGNDIFGELAKNQFKKEGIQIEWVLTDLNHPSGVALINVDANGENCITVASGANGYLTESDIDKASDLFQKNDIVLIQLEIPLQTVIHAIKMAKQNGIFVILNPAPAAQIPIELYPFVDAITPNETEAELLTGVKIVDQLSAEKAAKIFIERGIKNVIITLGAKGAFYKTNQESYLIPGHKVAAIDTTAAGDCFNGALAVGLHNSLTWPKAIQFACQAASISVTKLGAQASMPTLEQL